MTVDTGKVKDRRELRLESLDDVLAEAERLATAEQVALRGNWTLGQVLKHLAIAQDMTIDGFDESLRPNFLLRLLAPLMKNGMLNKGMPAGFQIPQRSQDKLVPDAGITTEEGLAALRASCHRLQTEPPQPSHPAFGKMSPEQWLKLHLRHAELHFSFATPTEGT